MSEQSETMKFSPKDEITIMRGLHRGTKATVLAVDYGKAQYAVTLADGSFAVINAVNVREPEEVTITAQQLADALGNYAEDLPVHVLEALETAAPGITERFVISKAVA